MVTAFSTHFGMSSLTSKWTHFSYTKQETIIIKTVFFWFDLIVFFCRPLTKRRRESNPGRLGGKRERFLCAMPSPLP